jgi:large subunit ribosomal protein L13
LGRLSTQVATYLRGKHKPTYAPHLDTGDFVIVVNAAKVRLTGRKIEQKRYYHHSGYPGGLHVREVAHELENRPERVIERAVKGMLPKGPLGLQLFRHLKVYRGPEHPHNAQVAAPAPAAFVAPAPAANSTHAPRPASAVAAESAEASSSGEAPARRTRTRRAPRAAETEAAAPETSQAEPAESQ